MKVAVVGLGLIGASFCKCLISHGHSVFGYDIDENVLEKAVKTNAITEKLNDFNIKTATLFVVAVSPEKLQEVLDKFLNKLSKNTVVTDFCGVKVFAEELYKKYSTMFTDLVFIGGHPMAGKEVYGFDNSISTLFDNASMILCPINADEKTIDFYKGFYISLGFRVVEICTAKLHDKIISYTSELCHIASNAFIKNQTSRLHDGFSAGSYSDLTRVARLNPKMWSEIMMRNQKNLLDELSEYIENLKKYQLALQNFDKVELEKLLDEGNQLKNETDGKL